MQQLMEEPEDTPTCRPAGEQAIWMGQERGRG
jgi:hypothetical protein